MRKKMLDTSRSTHQSTGAHNHIQDNVRSDDMQIKQVFSGQLLVCVPQMKVEGTVYMTCYSVGTINHHVENAIAYVWSLGNRLARIRKRPKAQ